jgi:bifunctional non-homologous end joining protein LigD
MTQIERLVVPAARRGRIFIDYLRNDRTATRGRQLQPAQTCPRPGCFALSWDEVTPKLDPLRFTILTVPEIVANRAEPWGTIGQCRQRLRVDAVGRLAA